MKGNFYNGQKRNERKESKKRKMQKLFLMGKLESGEEKTYFNTKIGAMIYWMCKLFKDTTPY